MTGSVTTPLSTPTPANTTHSTAGKGTTTDSVRFNSNFGLKCQILLKVNSPILKGHLQWKDVDMTYLLDIVIEY